MTEPSTEVLTVVVERELPHPPEKIWRALTQPDLIAQWLMKNDFALQADHAFTLRGEWGEAACRVLVIEPQKTLSYTWDAMGVETIVTYTLTPAANGTTLRVEQAGFRPDQKQAIGGAKYGWNTFFNQLDTVVAGLAG